MESIVKPRIAYLDVDDTILVWNNECPGFAAPRATDFLLWLNEHFEIRWLTAWCPSGRLQPHGAEELAHRLHNKISEEFLLKIVNPNRWINNKTEGIDFEDSRPWVWIEDRILDDEHGILGKLYKDNYYPTHVTHTPVALQITWTRLAKKFNLSGAPAQPYITELFDNGTIIKVNQFIKSLEEKNKNG